VDPSNLHDVDNRYTFAGAGDWLTQVNAANFAGHSDWRLPSDFGANDPPTSPDELLTILVTPCRATPCIDPIFGPTAHGGYWSATRNTETGGVWIVFFNNGDVTDFPTDVEVISHVRAVRSDL
jgi:hypothetical protein